MCENLIEFSKYSQVKEATDEVVRVFEGTLWSKKLIGNIFIEGIGRQRFQDRLRN